jgi:hypothetical protein
MSAENRRGVDPDPVEEEVPWEEVIRNGIGLAIENFDLFYYPAEDSENQIPTPINLSPQSLTEGEDDRTYLELNPEERKILRDEMFDQLGIDPKLPDLIGRYPITAPPASPLDSDPSLRWVGQGVVQVFRTAREEEGISLHEITYPDERVDFFLAAEDYRFE